MTAVVWVQRAEMLPTLQIYKGYSITEECALLSAETYFEQITALIRTCKILTVPS